MWHSFCDSRGALGRVARRVEIALVVAAAVLDGCSAGNGSYSAPPPTPTYLSGTPGTVATVGREGATPTVAPPGSTPVATISAGTPIPLTTVGTVPPHSPLSTPEALAPPSSNTPMPVSCGATDGSGTPIAQGAATPQPSQYGPIVGPPAPGPFQSSGSVTVLDGLAALVGAYDTSFVPNTIFVKPGQKVTLDVKNGAGITHDFCAPALGIDNPIRIDRPRVPEDVLTAVVIFTAPQQPGVYMFWSNQQGQAQRGMVGEVVVRP